MIEDAELRALFKAEGDEHLQKLDEGLLYLESHPGDTTVVDEVFRAAHSLKGNARMLGEVAVEQTAHAFEEALGEVKRGTAALTAATIERLYRGIDILRRLVEEAVTGADSGVDSERSLQQIRGEAPFEPAPPPAIPSASSMVASCALPSAGSVTEPGRREREPDEFESPDTPDSVALTEPGSAPPVALAERETATVPATPAEEPTRTTPTGFRVESVRLSPQKLDALLTLAGELTVTTRRLTRGAADFESLVSLWEEWSKDLWEQRHRDRNGAAPSDPARWERDQVRLERMADLLARIKRTTGDEIGRLDGIADDLESAIRETRLLPLSTIFGLFPRAVRDLAHVQGKEIDLVIEGAETTVDRRILEEIKDPLLHMIRNAIDHGLETPDERVRNGKSRTGRLRLGASHTPSGIVLEIEDDGRGLDLESIRRHAIRRRLCRDEELANLTPEQVRMLIFAPGFSTSAVVTDVSGRGVGLDVVRANVESLKGTIHIESEPGCGCRFRILLPATLATTPVLLAGCGGQVFAIPVAYVVGTSLIGRNSVFRFEGRETIRYDDQPISVAPLSRLLDLPPSGARRDSVPPNAEASLPCVVMSVNGELFGLLVDALLDEQQVMFKPLSEPLRRVRNVAGATILGTGDVCLILNPHDLLKSLTCGSVVVSPPPPPVEETPKIVLLVDDSITVRTQEKRILESAGYRVVTAVDGLDALRQLTIRDFDAVVSDIEMPNMTGLTLAARIREDPMHKEIPIILVTSLATDEDRRRGLEVGADAYITKGNFDQRVLIETLRRLV